MSLTYKGVIALVIYQILKVSGMPVPGEGAVETTIDMIIQVGLAVITLYGRWRVGDLKVFGARK